MAAADSTVRIAIPHSTVAVDGDELTKIAKIMQVEGAKHLIVGLPRNAKGEETIQSQKVRAFAKSLQDYFAQHRLGRPLVKFQDESLTSVIAEERLTGKKQKKRRQKVDIDSEAAAIILQDFLDSFGGDSQSEHMPNVSAKKKRKVKSKIFKFFVIVVGLLLIAVAGAAIWYAMMTKPVTSQEMCEQEKCISLDFVVAEGESTSDIADRLESKGLIRSALAFKIYLRLNHEDAIIRVGTYSLNSSMSISDIISKLQGGSAAETFRITFLPGGTVADAKKRLTEAGFTEAEIEAGFATKYDHPVFEGKPDNGTLEGYIYGETYEFYAEATVGEVLTRTFDELYKAIQENDLVAKYAEKNMTLYEGITLASIVQRESYAPDMPQVAQVFLLRLKESIPLGSCAVIEYRADQLGREWTASIYQNKDELGCPWSSRFCAGLPPNPISSPGKAALISVADSAPGSYLFFFTDDEGKMRFNYTAANHDAEVAKYCKVRCARP